MAGPLDILKSIAGTHTKGWGGSASGSSIPAIDDRTIKSYQEISSTLSDIQSRMRNLSRAGATEGLEKYAKTAKKLGPVQKAIEDVADAEREYLALLRDENATVHSQVQAYDKLSEAKKKQVRISNEAQGAMGRLKNVLDDVHDNRKLLFWTALMRDANVVLKAMSSGFSVMAQTGQALDASFSDLVVTTGKYAAGLKFATLQGGRFGFSVEESEDAFRRLVTVMGGTDEAISSVHDSFSDLAAMAKFSGMTLATTAGIIEKSMGRLNMGYEESRELIAEIGIATNNLNKRFGCGRVNAEDYAKAFTQLAFSSSMFNQNSKLLNQTLSKELAIQLSLGKSRDAALAAATRNVGMAGQTTMAGSVAYGRQVSAEFRGVNLDSEQAMQMARERFGNQAEVFLNMMKRGGVTGGRQVLGFHKLMQDSDAARKNLMDRVRKAAASEENYGPLARMAGLDPGTYQVLQAEEGAISDKLGKVRATRGKGGAAAQKALQSLFPERDAEELQKDKKVQELLKDLQDPEKNARAVYDAFLEAQAKAETEGSSAVDYFLGMIGGKQWFVDVVDGIKGIAAAMKYLPTALAGLAGSLVLRKFMGGGGGGILSGLFKGGMKGGPTLPGFMPNAVAGTAAANAGRAGFLARAGAGVRGFAGGALGKAGAVLSKAAGPLQALFGLYNYASTVLSSSDPASFETHARAAGNVINGLLLGLPKMLLPDSLLESMTSSFAFVAEGFGNKLYDAWEASKGYIPFLESDEEKADRLGEAAIARRKSRSAGALENAMREAHRRKQAAKLFGDQENAAIAKGEIARPSQGAGVSAPDRTGTAAGTAGGAGAVATASVSGGNLILEVTNWDSVLAQSMREQESYRGVN